MGCSVWSIMTDEKRLTSTVQQTSQLTEDQIEQLLKTRFSRSEIHDWHRAFLNQSGDLPLQIEKSRFIDYFHQLHPTGDVTRLSETFFRAYDLNRDGKIDFMEFMHAVSIIRRGDLTEKLSLLFSLLDVNQEGFIDRLKLVQIVEALYQAKGLNYQDSYNVLLRKADQFIARADQDKEGGRIPRYKFIESCLNDTHFKDILNSYK